MSLILSRIEPHTTTLISTVSRWKCASSASVGAVRGRRRELDRDLHLEPVHHDRRYILRLQLLAEPARCLRERLVLGCRDQLSYPGRVFGVDVAVLVLDADAVAKACDLLLAFVSGVPAAR
jgi:hypothetical protein